MLGTLINVGTVALGSLIGLTFRNKLPERMITTTFHILGVFTLFLGVHSMLDSNNTLVVLLSVLIGGVIGELLRLESGVQQLAQKFQGKDNKDPTFVKGLMTAFMLFCVGTLTVLGCFDEGIRGDRKLIITKSIMDLFSSTALAAAFGRGVLFSVIPLFIYQGSLTLLAVAISPMLNQGMQSELSAAGGLMLIALGLNILDLVKIRVINLLPGLVVVVLITYLAQHFDVYDLDKLLH